MGGDENGGIRMNEGRDPCRRQRRLFAMQDVKVERARRELLAARKRLMELLACNRRLMAERRERERTWRRRLSYSSVERGGGERVGGRG